MSFMTFLFQTLLTGTVLAYFYAPNDNTYGQTKPRPKYWNWTLKEYLKKFEPRHVWGRIEDLKRSGVKLTQKQEFDMFVKGIDVTDEFLKLKVQNGDAKLLIMKDGRRWRPPPGLAEYSKDRFSLRRRLYELMKQAIYQARNKMVIMQQLRAKYKEKPLYKMGYLMSKTDTACKTFSKFAYRAFRGCSLGRQNVIFRHRIFDILVSEERVLSLWFTVELLVDLIRKNDENAKEILDNSTIKHKQEMWQFID